MAVTGRYDGDAGGEVEKGVSIYILDDRSASALDD
jgi:hypothetical protein